MKPEIVFIKSKVPEEYFNFTDYVMPCNNITKEYKSHLWISVYRSDLQDFYSKPMPWIGMYIASASLLCTLAMVADLLHGLHNRKLWFPCNYFTLNAASLTVTAAAIKLPMDLTSPMQGDVDRTAKFGSLSFMCTIMANLLPSLATMGSKELVSNMIALGILVITLVVKVRIQIHTGVLSYAGDEKSFQIKTNIKDMPMFVYVKGQEIIATVYVVMLLVLLIIYACSSLAILMSKEILDSSYQAAHRTTLKHHQLQQGRLTVEKLRQHVRNYWIMAGTGSPQFMTVCFPTTSAAGVICALSTVLHIFMMPYKIREMKKFDTNYKWSMLVILVIQFFRVIVGTLAPLSRCFAALSFKLGLEWIRNHIKVFKVEGYWTQKLSDWKQRNIPFPLSSHKGKIATEKLKILFLSICIGFQMIVVVACKMIAVIPLLFVICVSSCFRCWKWLIKAIFCASCIVSVHNPEHLRNDTDLSQHVLKLQDDMEFSERTLRGISKSVNRLIQKAEKEQPDNLIELLAKSKGFEGVEKFDSHQISSLLSEEYLNCWSLPLVTLTTIAISLPGVSKKVAGGLLSGVCKGLEYVSLVEERLNATDDHVSIQTVAKSLWLEVEVRHKWLGNKVPKSANTVGQFLRWLRDTSKNMVTEMENMDIGASNDSSRYRSISANSMYRITETLLLSNHTKIDQVDQEELLAQLTSMIADILAACLTNLPQAIAMKCHEVEIEKREASVCAAAQILGEATQIITNLQDRELPSLSLNDFAFIDKWRAHLKDAFP